jgi:hypothetical protein
MCQRTFSSVFHAVFFFTQLNCTVLECMGRFRVYGALYVKVDENEILSLSLSLSLHTHTHTHTHTSHLKYISVLWACTQRLGNWYCHFPQRLSARLCCVFELVQRSADTFLHVSNCCEPRTYKTALGEGLQYCLLSLTQAMPALYFMFCWPCCHLGIILVNDQLDAQFFFSIHLFQFSTCFEQLCAHHQENQLY